VSFTFDLSFWVILQLFILPVALPLLVGLVTTRVTSSLAKAIWLLALSVVTSLLTNMLAAFQSGAEAFDLGLALMTAFVTFVAGVGVHTGLLKAENSEGVSLTSLAQANGRHEKTTN
jgi:hypothetical protein